MSRSIFLSHSSEDEELVNLFVDVILGRGLEIKSRQIFCTSVDGMGIKTGEDFVNSLKTELKKCKVAIMILTENYKVSEVCLNEMGAVWVLSKKVFPFIVEPLNYNEVGVVHRNNHIAKIKESGDLDTFRDVIVEELGLDPVPTARWNTSKANFLKDAKKIKATCKNPKVSKVDYDKVLNEKEEVLEEYAELDEKFRNLQEKLGKISKLKDKKEVKKINKEYEDTSLLDEFEKEIQKINEMFSKIGNNAVTKTLLAEIYDVPPDIDYGNFSNDRENLESAKRKKYLDNEYETTSKNPLPRLENLIRGIDSYKEEEGFIDQYEEKYGDVEFEPSDEDFWERHYEY